ncbi:MAG: FHA domain-containing protein [Proteobacteria bacterium]|nr:FHA domain-containing protein [Pseudomonadota bacterium]
MTVQARQIEILGVKNAGRAEKIIVWDTQDLSVGRSPECDLVIDDDDVSRQHVIFRKESSGYWVEDAGTSNGTHVNGEPIERHQLASRDVIRIGALELTFLKTSKDPASMGLPVEYASSLKGGFDELRNQRPDATTLALSDTVASPVAQFDVESVGGFGFPSSPSEEPASDGVVGNGDLEFVDAPPIRDTQGTVDGAQRMALTVEIEGLSPDLRRALEALEGKVVELPSLRLRIKARDLD